MEGQWKFRSGALPSPSILSTPTKRGFLSIANAIGDLAGLLQADRHLPFERG
jgi:hypothetical protein